MASSVLKRLEEIAWMHRDGYMCASSCDTCWLLKLTRALLESQEELLAVYEETESCCPLGNPVWCVDCQEWNTLRARAERIRKGEV